ISKNIATTGALQGNTWTLEHEKAQKKAKEREAQAANLDEVSDEDLMLVCQTGKTEALDEIYRRYYRPMLLFIVRLVQNRDLAEDLVQETFLRVYNNRHSWEPKSKFSSWIYRIARNLCIDEKRRYWNRL